MRVARLTCEYFRDPLRIDAREPRLSWQLDSATAGARQTVHRNVCTSGGRTIWDSGRW